MVPRTPRQWTQRKHQCKALPHSESESLEHQFAPTLEISIALQKGRTGSTR